jgi:hypothetical protein
MHIVTAIRGKQLKIDFDPEIFGMRVNAFDNKVPFKGIKFNNFTYMTDDDQIIERLNRHPENEANGGTGFRIESGEATKEMLDSAGTVSVTSKDLDLSDRDVEALDYIEKYKDDVPDDKSKILDLMDYVLDRFGITAIRVPHIKSKEKRVTLVAYEILDVLEEKGVWPEPKSKAAVELKEEVDEPKPEPEVKNDGQRTNRKSKASK